MATAIVNKESEKNKPIPKGKFENTGLDKKKLVKRAQALQTEGTKWVPTWKELQQYEYPTKGFFDVRTPNQGSKIDHKVLVDEEATLDIDTFAAGMTSGFTSPSRPWFRFYFEEKDLMDNDAVKFWLQDVQETMYDIFHKSNTYSVLTSMYTELAPFCTACAIVEESFDTVIHLTNYTIGEYFLGRDKNGKVNAFYRKFWKTAGQIVDEFGIENANQTVQIAYRENRIDDWFIVNHLIEVNDTRIPFLKDYRNMEYRSIYWQDGVEDDKYLRLGGYEELPILGPRFEFTTNADAYGKGPGWKALGSVKELQKKVKNLLIALDKATDPPLQTDASVVGEVNSLPGGITKTSASVPNAGVRAAYEVKLDIANLDLSIEKTKQKIKKFFFADLFLMMIEAERQGSPVTATEIYEKQSERISKIGPILEMWQGDEFIKTLLDRTFAIGMRNRVFPEPPEAIRGKEIKIEYTSVLAQAQKMIDIQAIDIWVSDVLQEVEINPSSIDIINFDEKNRKKAEMLGVPPKIVNSIIKMADIRRKKAEQLEAAQANERMMAMAKAGADAGKGVKDMAQAPMGQNTALDKTISAVQEMNK
jgi:hypothetical protein